MIGVQDGSPSAMVGLQKDDIVLSLNGEKIHTTRDLQRVAGQNPYVWRLQIDRGGQVVTSVIGG